MVIGRRPIDYAARPFAVSILKQWCLQSSTTRIQSSDQTCLTQELHQPLALTAPLGSIKHLPTSSEPTVPDFVYIWQLLQN